MGMNPNSGLSEDYLDDLKNELLTATTAYNTYARAATKASAEHAQAKLYHSDLKGYCSQITVTYMLISDAYNYLNTLISHAENVSKNLHLSHESLGIIVRYLKCLCEEAEGLRITIRTLIDSVESIGDPVLNADTATLLTCLKDLETEVTATITTICTAIEAMIVLFRCLLDLTFKIGSAEEGAPTGLVNDFQQMRGILCCEYSAGISAELAPCPGDEMTSEAEAELADCCPGEYEIEERECSLTKPAVCEGGFASTFFQERIRTAMEQAGLLVEHKKCVLQFYEKKSAGALAKMEAITKALDAATAAKALCQ